MKDLKQNIVQFEYEENSNLIICKFPEFCFINLELAENIVKDRLEMSEGVNRVCLVYSSRSIQIHNSAINYMLSKESRVGVSAMAIMDKSKSNKLFLNILFKIFIWDTPLKIFSSEEKALSWLLKYNNTSH